MVKSKFNKSFIKVLKITGISLVSLLLLLFLIPILFPGTVVEKVKNWTNQSLDGELNFSKVRLSFFSHFPSLTVSLYDFSLKGSAPFKNETLVAADEIALGVNIKSLFFDKKINIDKIFIADAAINVQVNEKGEANYNVYKSTGKVADNNMDTAGTSLRLEKISISNSHFVYNDKSVNILLDAKGFNYAGNGDLSKAVFDLNSHVTIDSLDFYFDKVPYLKSKRVDGDLITKINTNSLAFIFEKNNLRINKLPVQLSGKLNFLKNGYDLDFTAISENSQLDDFVTALPPQYVGWQKNTAIKGKTDLLVKLKGQYIAATKSMPDLVFNMKIREGSVDHKNAPYPASNIYLNLQTSMPSINPDSLLVKVDSVFFNIDKDYLSAVIIFKGINNPTVAVKANASLDLEHLDRAFGFADVDLKGKFNLHLTANGQYKTGPNPNSIRHQNIILSTPAFDFTSSVKDGYFKYNHLPNAVSNINFNCSISNATNDYKNSSFYITNISATALNNFVKGSIAISSLKDLLVDANLQAGINLGDIKNIYPLAGLDVGGLLKVDIKAKGKYDGVAKTFPVTTADISLANGIIKTTYYPNPINKVAIKAKAINNGGGFKDLELDIEAASFQFEGKPFSVQASFKNFEDITYNIKANGELDVAKIYKVFSKKGMEVTGFIKANMELQGRQSDALNKRYSKLNNKGTLELKDIATTVDYLPKPFIIKEGLFTFQQDKMWFKQFKALYGSSSLSMDGYLQNVIEYALADKAVLKGNFAFKSSYINADELMVYSTAPAADSANKSVIKAVESGVIIIPANLDVTMQADVKKLDFNNIQMTNARGNVAINNGILTMQKTGFNLIGSEALVDATYSSQSLNKANFDFHITANDFDIKKAYDSIKMFRDAATAAGKAQGIVSIDYNLKGKLDGNMQPIYPSLQGGGVLSVKKVKVKGFKLFTMVSSKTGKDSIANPDVSKVDIKSTIKNNLITVERFKIKMAGFRLRMEGQTSFDGGLNLKLRLGLPPLGIIGIPMKITGTQDKPKLKLGKDNKDELEEKEYKEEGS
jgi:AsmA protein